MRISQRNSSLIVQAPAKLNLSLGVLGRRADGFHELETVMVSVALYDTICFTPLSSPEIEFSAELLRTSSSTFPVGGDNLVVRAANLLRRDVPRPPGVRIHLIKRIPCEAGMGGGSSDAAATFVGLNQLWGLQLESERLHELAAALGSDLNFFIDSHLAAICSGRGECISPLKIRHPLHFVVLKPTSGLSTGAVFRQWGTTGRAGMKGLTNTWQAPGRMGSLLEVSRAVSNCLEDPAVELNNEIGETLERLRRLNVLVAGMTGSGSACFGLCRSKREAQRIAAVLKNQGHSGTWAVSTGV